MDTTQKTKQQMGRMKTAELLSTLGAGVLGAGIALLLPNLLARFAVPILLIGLAAHATGMYQMRMHEQIAHTHRIWWMEALYWVCWLVLAGLFIYIVISLVLSIG